ncbi:MAG: hypothetical protein N3E37_04375 [Candidatus Micrarchaeota archaeon]|nr:hypothetical protein [Candidatus Micrarchaeota archaeon]
MGNVAIKLRILPKDNSSVEEMKKEISSKIKPYSFNEEELGFGIKALIAVFILSDQEGQQQKLEDILSSCTTVESYEIIMTTLVG